MLERKPAPGTILVVIAFGVFVAADDLTVVSTMLRQMIFDLEIPLPEGLGRAAWIVNAYLIAYIVVMPFVGRLSDIVGRRAVYVGALILFLVGSIWVPLANDLEMLVVGRVLSALGGGAMVPVGMAIVGDVYSRERRPTALGTLGAIDTAGWVWGPLYGALLVRFLDWRWQFYLNVPLSLFGIAIAWWALADLPRTETHKTRGMIDWLGTLLLTAALLTLNIALLSGNNIQSVGSLSELSGERSAGTTPLYLASFVCFTLFVVLERQLSRLDDYAPTSRRPSLLRASPLIELGLFRRPNFSPAVIINFLAGMVLIVAMINVPLLVNVLESGLEQAALTSGWLLSAMTASMALTAYVGGRLTERWSYRPVTTIGLAACVVAFAMMGQSWSVDSPTAQMAAQLVVLGSGFGLVTAPVGAAVINAASESERGIAASLVIVLRLIGMSVGLSSLTAWGLHRFDELRRLIELPAISEPGFQEALIEGLTLTTVAVLTETFLVSAGIATLALVVSQLLHPDSN